MVKMSETAMLEELRDAENIGWAADSAKGKEALRTGILLQPGGSMQIILLSSRRSHIW